MSHMTAKSCREMCGVHVHVRMCACACACVNNKQTKIQQNAQQTALLYFPDMKSLTFYINFVRSSFLMLDHFVLCLTNMQS